MSGVLMAAKGGGNSVGYVKKRKRINTVRNSTCRRGQRTAQKGGSQHLFGEKKPECHIRINEGVREIMEWVSRTSPLYGQNRSIWKLKEKRKEKQPGRPVMERNQRIRVEGVKASADLSWAERDKKGGRRGKVGGTKSVKSS